ncbi:MAG: UDP-N-acetylmuramoylalanyl-D-glutamyl-2,6-diaminopimelate--D-alanyl-D-alanine ligase [Hyphomicrobiales bacterium]|nr:UDP-N-acetylmuramoylalanyl-D-glutamyl-2,6-diaminopimelate--D-alanyl-D-alanine ligase [Hyphomicrobiales bacterium]
MNATPLWVSNDVRAATGGSSRVAWTATGVSIDSRSIAPGDLFVAIRGPSFDGHDFVAAALANGAAVAVVARVPEGISQDAPLLVVDDTMAALQALGRGARSRTAARVIGVTGSVGKTSVKEALRIVLTAQGETFATTGNLNNHWGLPLSLARLPRESAYAILEMGMNHPGELGPLSRLACPHVAVITTVAAVHRGNFESLEAIADAKAEILTGLAENGVAVLNRDNAFYARLAVAARQASVDRVISFGHDAAADVRLISSDLDAAGASVRAELAGTVVQYRVNCPGAHWVENSLCVLAACLAAGADVSRAAQAMDTVSPLRGRGEITPIRLADGGEFLLIDESYNASPASMCAAFEVLARTAYGTNRRRVAVLGEMLELGEDSESLHLGLAGPLQEHGADLVMTTGSHMSKLLNVLPTEMQGGHGRDSEALAPILVDAVRAGDVVMVKGSAGSRMGIVIDALKALDRTPAEHQRRASGR